jgi:hypothetical protein
MSKVFAFIKESNGEVAYTMTIGNAAQFQDGAYSGSFIGKDITHDKENAALYPTIKYFIGEWATGGSAGDDPENPLISRFIGTWQDKPEKPGDFYVWTENREWVFDIGFLKTEVRRVRHRMLLESDWTQMPDSPLNEEQKGAWATYRQQLRDITEQLTGITDIGQVPWPTEPVSWPTEPV